MSVPQIAGQERFEAALDAQFADGSTVRAAIDDYFGTEGGVFTGSLFELLASTDPYAFTAQDLVALHALSEAVPARVAYWLLGREDSGTCGGDIIKVSEYGPALLFSNPAPL